MLLKFFDFLETVSIIGHSHYRAIKKKIFYRGFPTTILMCFVWWSIHVGSSLLGVILKTFILRVSKIIGKWSVPGVSVLSKVAGCRSPK